VRTAALEFKCCCLDVCNILIPDAELAPEEAEQVGTAAVRFEC
jgi:hypothetical protein